MYDAHVFAPKYFNAEAKNTIIIDFVHGIVFFASALTYFVAKTCASYISRCVDIKAYLRQEQRTSIRKVSFFKNCTIASLCYGDEHRRHPMQGLL